MTESLPGYILAGRASDLSRWAEHAANLGILWCYEHERRGGNCCSMSCIRGGGCAITADAVALNVIPAESVSTFDGRDYEAILAVFPYKKLGLGDIDGVRSLVSRLMSAFRNSGIDCFESTTSPGGEIEWKPFSCP